MKNVLCKFFTILFLSIVSFSRDGLAAMPEVKASAPADTKTADFGVRKPGITLRFDPVTCEWVPMTAQEPALPDFLKPREDITDEVFFKNFCGKTIAECSATNRYFTELKPAIISFLRKKQHKKEVLAMRLWIPESEDDDETISISREQAPFLYAQVAALEEKLQIPVSDRFEKIEAYMGFKVFGGKSAWRSKTLYLGLPIEADYYKEMISDEHGIDAVLAHEVAHAWMKHHTCIADQEHDADLVGAICVGVGPTLKSLQFCLRHLIERDRRAPHSDHPAIIKRIEKVQTLAGIPEDKQEEALTTFATKYSVAYVPKRS